ncbi:MAG: glycosyltransferase family 4 protein [Planctomycetales bacterium]|nr:glycosyltransferase family 4 protein [Planctomycetales bacterium]
MKILFLAPQPFFQLRGTPIAVRRVVEVLGSAGHSIQLLTFPEGEDIELPNCTVNRTLHLPFLKSVPPGFSIGKLIYDTMMFFKAFSMCRRKSFDVVHAVEESVFIARALKFCFGTPYLYDMDSSLPGQLTDLFGWLAVLRRPLQWIETIAIRGSCGVIAVCHALEDTVHRASPSTPVLRMEDANPHANVVMTEADAAAFQLPVNGSPNVMYIGNLQKYQGIDLLLDAFAAVSEQLPEAMLHIVGGAESDIHQYQRLANDLEIGERVHFLGTQPLESVPLFLRHADIVVSPRIHGTNTPMKVYSYMDSDVPLVATRLTTHTQVLSDKTSWLAEPNAQSFSQTIVEAWRNRDESRRKATAAKLLAEHEYSAEIQDEKLITFYEDVEARIRRSRQTIPNAVAMANEHHVAQDVKV